ncbi:BTB-POZ and MATH domain 2 [Striga asiatica]|uniref:BTB-POZ and MATH domain 2 n=1 Tax=Striga asiatica TaxID=4170 RepID=A0A5A7QVX2_STRAF|nr:BTB-POZ and MATH domain 2 [Striga asiatica]
MATIFTPFMLSWKTSKDAIGVTASERVLMTFEKSEETTKIKPTTPTEQTCHDTAVQTTTLDLPMPKGSRRRAVFSLVQLHVSSNEKRNIHLFLANDLITGRN